MPNGKGRLKCQLRQRRAYAYFAKRERPIRRLGSIPRRFAGGKTVLEYGANRTIFVQGDPADSVWYLQRGKVKLAVTSQQGKEAIVTVLGDNEFFGEGCLAGQPLRISTATAVTDCTLYRIEKALMVRLLHEQHEISELFVTHLLTRNIRFEEDLVDQLFNSSEKRLARILLLLARILARKAEPKLSIPESIRNTWPRWSAPPGRGSVIS